MSDLLWIFISTLLINNFVLAYFLGICPFLGVSQRLDTAFRLGMATVFVMLITAFCVWFLNTYILIHAPYLRLISFIVVIASTVSGSPSSPPTKVMAWYRVWSMPWGRASDLPSPWC